jgi:hypothetical protein
LAYADVVGFDYSSLEPTQLYAEHHDAPHRLNGRTAAPCCGLIRVVYVAERSSEARH